MHNSLDLGPLLAPLWSFAPVMFVGLSSAGALRMALTLLEQVLEHQRKASAALVSILLGSLGVTGLLVAWRGVLSIQGLSSGQRLAGFAGLAEEAGLLALLDQVPPYALASGTFGVMLAVIALLGLAERQRPDRGGDGWTHRRDMSVETNGVTTDGYGRRHLRQVKADIKGRQGEDFVVAVLARLGMATLHDVILEDDRGLTQVDHLVLLPGGIAVLETKNLSGLVTGRPWTKQWTQHLGRGSVRTSFQNPLFQNYRHVEAVRQAVGTNVPVRGLVVSAGTARFCPELVGAVVPLADLAVRLTSILAKTCDPIMLDAACRELKAAAARSPELRSAHLEQVQGRCTARAGATWA